MRLDTGDLLFVKAEGRGLARAIAESTGQGRLAYSHVALLARDSRGRPWVLHASGRLGCARESLASFLSREKGRVDVFCLRDRGRVDWDIVFARAYSLLGSPYDPTFAPSRARWYCASFIWYSFQPFSLFHLRPMSFGPGGSVLPFWQAYYAGLHSAIPRGRPGTSPNTLLQQGVLQRKGRLS